MELDSYLERISFNDTEAFNELYNLINTNVYSFALSILKSVDYPLATSSANISGSVNNSNIEDIINDLENYVDIFIKGNISSNLLASTVAQIKDNEVNILRSGIISKENIEEVIRK